MTDNITEATPETKGTTTKTAGQVMTAKPATTEGMGGINGTADQAKKDGTVETVAQAVTAGTTGVEGTTGATADPITTGLRHNMETAHGTQEAEDPVEIANNAV